MPRRPRNPRASGTIQVQTTPGPGARARRTAALPLPAQVEIRVTDADGNFSVQRVHIDADGTFGWDKQDNET
jgi:hypothetical protein